MSPFPAAASLIIHHHRRRRRRHYRHNSSGDILVMNADRASEMSGRCQCQSLYQTQTQRLGRHIRVSACSVLTIILTDHPLSTPH